MSCSGAFFDKAALSNHHPLILKNGTPSNKISEIMKSLKGNPSLTNLLSNLQNASKTNAKFGSQTTDPTSTSAVPKNTSDPDNVTEEDLLGNGNINIMSSGTAEILRIHNGGFTSSKKERNLNMSNQKNQTTLNRNTKFKNIRAFGQRVNHIETSGNNRISLGGLDSKGLLNGDLGQLNLTGNMNLSFGDLVGNDFINVTENDTTKGSTDDGTSVSSNTTPIDDVTGASDPSNTSGSSDPSNTSGSSDPSNISDTSDNDDDNPNCLDAKIKQKEKQIEILKENNKVNQDKLKLLNDAIETVNKLITEKKKTLVVKESQLQIAEQDLTNKTSIMNSLKANPDSFDPTKPDAQKQFLDSIKAVGEAKKVVEGLISEVNKLKFEISNHETAITLNNQMKNMINADSLKTSLKMKQLESEIVNLKQQRTLPSTPAPTSNSSNDKIKEIIEKFKLIKVGNSQIPPSVLSTILQNNG
jgi:hypothetical protein